MSDLTLLTKEQCFGSEELDILKKRDTKAAITDFSILLGEDFEINWDLDKNIKISKKEMNASGDIDLIDSLAWSRWFDSLYENNEMNHIKGDDSLEGRTGCYWTKSSIDSYVDEIACSGDMYPRTPLIRNCGGRPALPFSSIYSIPINEESGTPKRARDGVLEVEYGYYPQKAVSRKMQKRLEKAFKRGRLLRTGKKYTTDSRKYIKYTDDLDEFVPKQHEEFLLDGKRYVRVEANAYVKGFNPSFKLSNGESYKNGDPVWVEVAPVKWLVDEKAKIMLTDKVIFSGVRFHYINNYETKDFEKTTIKIFMDNYLSKELESVRKPITLGELYNKNGYDKDGYDIYGFNREGIHKITGTKYDEEGFDIDGMNKNGTFNTDAELEQLEIEQKKLQNTLRKSNELENQVDKQIQQKDKNVTEDKEEEEK